MQKKLYIIVFLLFSAVVSWAGNYPGISIYMSATTADGKSVDSVAAVNGSAPINVTFHYKTTDADDWTLSFEWRFAHQGESLDSPYMIRYEDEPQVTFTQAGTDSIALYAVFTRGTEERKFQSGYWHNGTEGATPLTVHATESKLTFPNAFSPNGDGINDHYKPKEFTSIVEFHAIIFNRWGHKIYEWNDVTSEGWDGTINGHDAKQGTYFVLCRAKGADGTEFEIKKDVNLLRTYDTEADTTSTGSTE